jgi:radical SAM/Cys-rich protein
MQNTLPLLEPSEFPQIHRRQLETLQVNIGLKCNQQCVHCHVDASPRRTEAMTSETINDILSFLKKSRIKTLDITGGAPELHPDFRRLITETVQSGIHIIDRCNLTILLEPGQADLAEFLAFNKVEIVASLPCYQEHNVDRQRGKGVFHKSILALQQLNHLGYGKAGSELELNLVYNPQGPELPPSQDILEQDYKEHLSKHYGIEFNHLFTLCNMPIKRFGRSLVAKGQLHDYINLLKNAFQPENLENVMCRSLISIDWQGYVYDCDFNQMLDLPTKYEGKHRVHISELLELMLENNPIVVCDHCFGCAAGQGSSCSGALS